MSQIDYKYILGADIETSRVTPDNGDDIQVPFLTNTLEIDIETGEFTNSTFNRTIDEWLKHLNEISSEDRIRIVYCQNLFYEITFIMRQTNASFIEMTDKELNAYGLTPVDGVMRSTTDIVYCRLDCCPNIIFRDSLSLFNKSLQKMGEDLSKRLNTNEYHKLDYDYEKVRLPWDDLEKHDYDYNEMDNKVVLMSIYFFIKDRNLKMENCPLTSTADTKRARREYIKEHYSERHLKQINRDKHHTYKEYDFYSLVRETYQGGFTGANFNYINKLARNVYSVDIKSSYPYQMVSRQFPIFNDDPKTTFAVYGNEANEIYHESLHGLSHSELQTVKSPIKGYYAMVEFKNIRIKSDKYLLDISEAHVNSLEEGIRIKGVIINGKIKEAENFLMAVNNVDLDRILMLYHYDELIVHELWATTKSRQLPEGEISFILDNFNKKEDINKELDLVTYNLAKIRINAMYGVKVQNEVKDFTSIKEGKIVRVEYEKINDKKKYENINLSSEEVYKNTISKMNRNGFKGANFDIYSDGVYITSFARTMLMEMSVRLINEGFDIVYSDTDSLKFTAHNEVSGKKSMKKVSEIGVSTDRIKNIFEIVNKDIINHNMKNIRFQECFKRHENLNKEKIYKLGTWEIESVNENGEIEPYKAFKTLGAKKYCYYGWNKKANKYIIETTVAGCKKSTFSKAITNYAKTIGEDEESSIKAMNYIFNTGTLVHENASGRTTATYEDRTYEECMTLTYEGKQINSAGGVIIHPTTYTLNVSKNDSLVLGENLRQEMWVKTIDLDGNIEYNENGVL